jgi:hypothetical protein
MPEDLREIRERGKSLIQPVTVIDWPAFRSLPSGDGSIPKISIE